MESKYTINVSNKGQFFFRVEETSAKRAKEVVTALTTRFPECIVSTTYYECVGHRVELDAAGNRARIVS
jgi:hypothetical protein